MARLVKRLIETKVLALNSSPNIRRGGTITILKHFLRGMEEAGAEVELLHLSEKDIKPCNGCMGCWVKTPGECVQRDDMAEIVRLASKADILVLATPLYVDGMNAQMKKTVDRLLPLLEPYFEIRDGHCRHVVREGVKRNGKLVLVSVCGFHETDNFEPLEAHVKAISLNMDREYVGAVLRPYAKIFPFLKMKGIDVNGVYEAVREAGAQLVKRGEIDPRLLDEISRDLVTKEELVDGINARFRQIQKLGPVMRAGNRLRDLVKPIR